MTPLPPGVRLQLAPNPGPMTLEGTCTWLLDAPGGPVVVDPGPDDEAHLAALAAAGPALVVLTHRHADHAAGAARLHALTGAPVRAADPALCRGATPLVDGEELPGGAAVLAAPGHTSDSVCLVLPGAVLTGDTVLGRGTTVIDAPDGRLGAYLATLERLAALGERTVLPGHGPVLPSVAAAARRLHEHRLARVAEVRAALDAGARTPEEVVVRVYPGLAPELVRPALLSTAAAVAYLERF
ncbi:glyoxylase-like metal-dependent hydrolase (beta-lactamase superfamily II) [Motilibacter rhizosphaerae]|uniref:Glyoxylase-like metal-dependent hydrolase (Beta-lactamase superfamily II) n=1 Tax=Motilibacter rhizosphaerae TaxID=598652 RepID=A0A4Q7NZD9_9ACTN|nr:MBL fold metallo-hydrolase [Motilibacter rhizosphaerae]RZS91802.1 glyoxylase-like metal-dependent hydrolase (beta-lactamase superfamily II) [Motilibacter rhizosphaerae]